MLPDWEAMCELCSRTSNGFISDDVYKRKHPRKLPKSTALGSADAVEEQAELNPFLSDYEKYLLSKKTA